MKLWLKILIFFFISSNLHPCSIFKYTIDGKVYFCGNEDWTAKDPAVQTYKADKTYYAYILFGWESYLPHYAQAGINSEGLCFDWAVVPPQRYIEDKQKGTLSIDFVIDILKTCKNIFEAVDFVKKYNIPHFAEEHIMFTDKKGNSCVIEYNNGKLQILIGNSEAQYMTNFHLSDKGLGWFPCDRFSRLESFFKEVGNKEDRLVEILDKVHQEGPYPTIYSYIFDLKNMEISVFFNHNYDIRKKFQFNKLIESNGTIKLYM